MRGGSWEGRGGKGGELAAKGGLRGCGLWIVDCFAEHRLVGLGVSLGCIYGNYTRNAREKLRIGAGGLAS